MKKKLLVYSCETLIIISFTSLPYDSDNLLTDKLTTLMILFPMVLLLSRKIVDITVTKVLKKHCHHLSILEAQMHGCSGLFNIHKTNSFERADKVIKLNNWRWKVKYPAVFNIQCSKTGWERRQTSNLKIRTTFFSLTKYDGTIWNQCDVFICQ